MNKSRGFLDAAKILRTAAQYSSKIIARAIRDAIGGVGAGDEISVMGLASQMDYCHQYGEFLHSQMETCQNFMDDPTEDDDDDDDIFGDEGFRGAFKMAYFHSKLFCDELATARLKHASLKEAKKGKK